MPTATDNRPDEDQDRIQQHYEDQFDTLNSAEQQAKPGVPDDLGDGKEDGFFRDEGSGAAENSRESGKGRRVKHDDPVNPDDGLYSEDDTKSKRSRFLPFSISRRKGVTGGIIGVLLGSGVFFGFGIASGPLQVIHLGEVLHHSFNKNDSDSANRTRHLFRYARASKNGNIGETRVGILGSKVFGKTLDQLHEMGVDIETGRVGQPTKTTINTDKLKENFPELEGKNTGEKKAFIADRLGVDIESISGSGAKFSIDQSDMNIRSSRLLSNNTVGLLDDGKIVSGIKSRVLTKVFDLPSLFHPIQKASAAVQKKLVNGKAVSEKEQADADEADQKSKLTEAVTADAEPVVLDAAAKKLGGVGSAVNKSVTFTGAACEARKVAKEIPLIDRIRVVLPAIVQSTRAMAIGSQVKSGQDITSPQIGAVTASFRDSKGKSIWQSKPLQILAGGSGAGLADISNEQKQAFGSHAVVDNIDSLVEKSLGGKYLAGAACSTAGTLIQGAATLTIAGIAGSFSGGAGAIAVFGLKQALQFVAVTAATKLVEDAVFSKTTAAELSKTAFSGPGGGGLFAYGARGAANTVATGTGGVDLGSNESKVLADREAKADKQEFESKSMFARMFDASDYRSLTGRLADSISPNAGQNLVSVASSLTHMASSITGLFGVFTPHAAADGSSYDWGFSQFGIPQKLLDDPKLSDPYNNASIVTKRLDSECRDDTGALKFPLCDVINKVKICFGSDVNLQIDPETNAMTWDVVATAGTKGVDTESDDYINQNCGDISDENWNRIIMWVFDTNTMKSAACYQGDEQSCQDIGAAPSSSGGGSQFNIASYNILHSIDSPGGQGASDWKKRAVAATANIKANSMDIVGVQEMQENQFNEFRKDLPDYKTYPETFKKGSNNTIFYSSKFSLVTGQTFVVPYYKDSDSSYPDHLTGQGTSPEIELRDNSTGQTFWVLNTHLPAYFRTPSGGGGAIKREQGAKILLAEAKKLSAGGSPVFVTGDINSATKIRAGNRDTDIHGDRSRIPYCVLTSDGTLVNTVDILKGRTGACPDKGGDIKIDQVYATPTNVTVSSAKVLAGSTAQTGTDHAGPMVASVTIGGGASDASGASSTDTASAAGWKWPIALSDYTGLSECWNASYSGGHHAGQDIRAASGTNVYAAHDGTVTSYAYNSAGGNTLLVSADNGLWYNYQHLKSSKVKKGDKVTAGQLVAISDNTGGNTTGAHLHFGIAVAPTTGSYANNSQTRDPLKYLPTDRKENGCN